MRAEADFGDPPSSLPSARLKGIENGLFDDLPGRQLSASRGPQRHAPGPSDGQQYLQGRGDDPPEELQLRKSIERLQDLIDAATTLELNLA